MEDSKYNWATQRKTLKNNIIRTYISVCASSILAIVDLKNKGDRITISSLKTSKTRSDKNSFSKESDFIRNNKNIQDEVVIYEKIQDFLVKKYLN